MKTELFSIFSEKQIQAIKDCIRYGMWGNADCTFGNDDKCVTEWGYCTSDISKGGHYKSKEISGICSGIAKTIKENNLNWIIYEADYWEDGTSGVIFFHTNRLDTTNEELAEWAKEERKMNYTNFFSIVDKIKSCEYQELYTAIKAHGGKFSWNMDEGEECPLIAINVDSITPSPCDVYVTCVKISSDDILKIYGEEKEYGNEIKFQWSDVFAGHLSSIIDYLPATNEVSDVSDIGGIITVLESFKKNG